MLTTRATSELWCDFKGGKHKGHPCLSYISSLWSLVHEFFYAVSYSAGMNLHLKMLDGENTHHIIEAAFKAFAKALDEAVSYDERIGDVLSTKGKL